MTVDVQDSAGYHHGLALFLYAVVIERMKKMNIEINGVTLQADFMDADFMEVFEPAIFTMREGINASKTLTSWYMTACTTSTGRMSEPVLTFITLKT